MAKSFSLNMYPWIYIAKFSDNRWMEKYVEQPHKTPEEEVSMSEEDMMELLLKRNTIPGIPVITYTSQYGMGCFEGLKAFPQPNGSIKIFRPDENGKRFKASMEGVYMPGFPVEKFVESVKSVIRKNAEIGFTTKYDKAWEKDNFLSGTAMYLRPFAITEPGIGVNISSSPWVITVATPVGAYFESGSSGAVTTERVRANSKGTGCLKVNSNYVISACAKHEAMQAGFMEAVFLDAEEKKYLEEGSSSNIFCYLKNGTLVTPNLGDTILPGITRKSILKLAQDMGIKTEERKISIDEAMADSLEMFVSGTAAGIAFIDSMQHKGKKVIFNNGKMGNVATKLLAKLKGIQYGKEEDKYGWMFEV
ncbi:MAG: branched-chain-amino-acid transaminase [Spirochaetaceae bacterium]|nr:branched-chain-amino-acid transaminase [Spirochaetaceae bacterium]